MRALYDLEKDIIRSLIDYHNRGIIPNIASLVDPLLRNIDIHLDYQNRAVELKIDQADFTPELAIDTVRSLTAQLLAVVNLLDYLEKNGYVSLYWEATPGQHERFGQLIEGNTPISYALPDRRMTDLLLENSLKSILVGQPLIEFAQDGFRTKDDIAFRTNMCIALSSLGASVVIGLIGLWLNYKSLPPTAIDQPSINQITAPMVKAIGNDSLLRQEVGQLIHVLLNDTLMVKDAQPKQKATK